MNQEVFIAMIKSQFAYPLNDYGFSLVHLFYDEESFGNQVVVFVSGRCGINFILDRGRVAINVASADYSVEWALGIPNRWFSLVRVIAYLTPNITVDQYVSFYAPTERGLPDDVDVHLQLANLTEKTRPYWNGIIDMAKSGELNSREKEIKMVGDKLIDESLEKAREEGRRKRMGQDGTQS